MAETGTASSSVHSDSAQGHATDGESAYGDQHAGARGALFDGYGPALEALGAWDEAFAADATPRSHYAHALDMFAHIGADDLAARQGRVEQAEAEQGITFWVSGEGAPRVFPTDPIPRIIDADTWATLSAGLEQRARALNAFLDDVYGPQRIVDEGIVELADLERAPGYVDEGRLQPPGAVRAHICGMDLVCDAGRWMVLEDNLRVPSGIVFSHFLRQMAAGFFGDVLAGVDVHDPRDGFDMLRETLRAAAPAAVARAASGPGQYDPGTRQGATAADVAGQNSPIPNADAAGQDVSTLNPGGPRMALVSVGPTDSAWFEHSRIAEFVGMPVCTPDHLAVIDGYLHHRDDDGATHRLDVVYARIERTLLFDEEGFDGVRLGDGLVDAMAARRVAFVNAFGNGVADDKAIYALVPEIIRFYLDEEPLLDQVPTDLCHKPGSVDAVIERLHERVVKPVDGYGGAGITIGPECSEAELAERAGELRAHPERFIAQDVVTLSTLPTWGEDVDGVTRVHPRHVDLRVFVHVRATPDAQGADAAPKGSIAGDAMTAHVVPAALTRTAPAGSLIVNTSRGGGGKDTWILRDPQATGGADA